MIPQNLNLSCTCTKLAVVSRCPLERRNVMHTIGSTATLCNVKSGRWLQEESSLLRAMSIVIKLSLRTQSPTLAHLRQLTYDSSPTKLQPTSFSIREYPLSRHIRPSNLSTLKACNWLFRNFDSISYALEHQQLHPFSIHHHDSHIATITGSHFEQLSFEESYQWPTSYNSPSASFDYHTFQTLHFFATCTIKHKGTTSSVVAPPPP